MTRTRVHAVALTLGLAAIALAGCKDKNKEAGGANGPDVPSAALAAGGTGSAFAMIPADGWLVGGVNLAAIRGTKLWEQAMPLLKQQGGTDLAEFQAVCGMDPFTVIESVTFGGDPEKENVVIAVKTKTNKAEVLDCAKKVAEKQGKLLTIEEDGQYVKVASEGNTQWMAFLGDGTVITGAKAEGEGGKAWLESIVSSKTGIQDNAALMGLVKQTDTGAAVWVAAIPPADDMKGVGGGSEPPKSMYGALSFKTGLRIDAGLAFATVEGAKAMSDQANAMMGPMGQDPTMGKYVKKVTVTPEATAVKVKVDLDQAEFDEFLAIAMQQLPMLMMMAGGGM